MMDKKKTEDLVAWYLQLMHEAEMTEHYITGCYVLRPWAFNIWEVVKNLVESYRRKLGYENCYFPLFIPQAVIAKEHEAFPYVYQHAWVTRAGDHPLTEPLSLRHTSEPVIFPVYAKWIKSRDDLPIKLNQWCNIVRWEAEDTILPFLRTREFLWHEGHAAHATSLEAQIEVEQTIAFYEEFYENQLAVPVIKGRKTLKEKFAAAEFSNTVEIYIPASGRGIQAATAHYIGENYARVYAICYEDKDSTTRHYVHQSSWGMTTRCIGILAMIHGDDKGLVLPPKVSPIQVVIIPRFASLTEQEKNEFQTVCSRVQNELVEAGVRVLTDRRHRYSAEQKILHWVVKGVPVIMDVKPEKEHEGHVFITKRHSGERTILESDKLTAAVLQMLEEIQAALYTKAKADLQDNVVTCTTFTELCEALDEKKLILAPFCAQPACEENIRRHSERAPKPEDGTLSTGARALCIPFNQPGEVTEDMTCVYPGCKRNPESYCLFGKCY